MIHLWSWNEAPVEAHEETSLANAVNDHGVVHLTFKLTFIHEELMMQLMTMTTEWFRFA